MTMLPHRPALPRCHARDRRVIILRRACFSAPPFAAMPSLRPLRRRCRYAATVLPTPIYRTSPLPLRAATPKDVVIQRCDAAERYRAMAPLFCRSYAITTRTRYLFFLSAAFPLCPPASPRRLHEASFAFRYSLFSLSLRCRCCCRSAVTGAVRHRSSAGGGAARSACCAFSLIFEDGG